MVDQKTWKTFLALKTSSFDLVELAKRRWVNKMSYRNIATSMKITRGQVDWGLRQFKIKYPTSCSKDRTIILSGHNCICRKRGI
jgi:hypothetical protein